MFTEVFMMSRGMDRSSFGAQVAGGKGAQRRGGKGRYGSS